MAAHACAVGVPSENWFANRVVLVTRARAAVPFAGVDWDSASWDVSEAYRHRTRGYKADRPAQRLLFTQHGDTPRVPGAPLSGPFGDVVKSLVCLRHRQRGQSAGSHMVFVRATRYVFDALADRDHDIGELTADHLDAAAARLFERERESSAYKVVGHIEEFADALDRNGLCRLRLDWRCRRKRRPKSMTPDRIDAASQVVGTESRLPDEDAIRAIGSLYQQIPRCASPHDPVSADRILILIATVMVCTGLRIGEMLTLPEKPLSLAEDGSKILRYARLKGRADDVTVEWESKPLLTETEPVVEAALTELRQATEGARQVARSFHESGGLLAGIPLLAEIDGSSLPSILVLRSNAVAQFLKARSIAYKIVGGKIRVARGALLRGIRGDHWMSPTIPGAPGRGLALHEALCVAYTNQMHRGTRTTLTYAARPITDQNVHDFLTGRGVINSVFERYAIVDSKGGHINVRSHGFRHFLNHLLDEGGAPDLVQTKWFGRKHAADTKAYQHLTYAGKAAKVVEDIMAGRINGAIAGVAKALPTERAQAFLAARIHAVHDVGPGMCIHDFQMEPCPRHLQCTVNCDEYIWLANDVSRADELKRQAAVAYRSLQNVLEQIDGHELVSPDWLRHLRIRYKQLMTQLIAQGFGEADLMRYIDEGGGNAEGDSCEYKDQRTQDGGHHH
ncbi:integrase [Paraburkholderia tropica]|uniref:integrase n=1 Tax=Paraburkholderia tropica TaxID=92647 RepID=UPI002AB64CEE|nr:integrase [Paraburkholderia tropica]